MGCGASNDATATPIVPATNGEHKAQLVVKHNSAIHLPPINGNGNGAQPHPQSHAPGSPAGASSAAATAAAGTASGRSPGRGENSVGSRRATLASSDDDGGGRRTPTGSHRNLATLVGGGAVVPADSQIPGLNYCNQDYFGTHMEQTWNHYARGPDYKLIDKNGLKAMAEDAVESFVEAARRDIQKQNPKWKEEKVQTKIDFLRQQFMPGGSEEDAVTIAMHYLAHELKFAAADDGQEITLEREILVQKLNKQGVDKANKSIRSLTGKRESLKPEVSVKGTRSHKGTSSKIGKKSRKSHHASSNKKENLFGDVDFAGAESSKSHK